MTIKLFILWGLVIICLILIIFSVISSSIKNMEQNECLKWREEQRNNNLLYYSDWQFKQCERWDLPLKK